MAFVASNVVDAGLSSLFQRMFDTLSAPPFLKSLRFLFGGAVQGEAQKLKSTFSRIQALLNDAEDRQIKEESVRLWLRELKDAAYDAEDVLDEVEYLVLRSKVEAEAPMQTRKRKRSDQVSDLYYSSVSNLNMGPRIEEIRKRLEEIESRGNQQLHLQVIRNSESFVTGKRTPTSSIIDESTVFGRETDREKVVGLLTSEDSSASHSSILQVVPICGMGGLGKTTLAQLVYNDERVVEHFEVRAWVYVSENDFDLMRLTNAIAEEVCVRITHPTSLDKIQVRIQKKLLEKRFLLVLDDVWNDNYNDWDALRAPLMVGTRTGSRILVTTRSQRVSKIMGTVPTHSLRGLSDEDCWSLFERRAFVEGNSDAHPDLVKIGKEIVNKCNGLPLAVKTLGGLLRSKVNAREWEAILKSEIWDLPEEKNDILPALKLSYHHLPAHLKRCFAYCGCLASKGLPLEKHELIEYWMAQGFIPCGGGKQMEDIAEECIDDLVSRSLFSPLAEECIDDLVSRSLFSPQTDPEDFEHDMHDLTFDLARAVLGADVLERVDGNSLENCEKVRYISHSCMSNMESINVKDLYCFKNLRNLDLYHTNNIPADLCLNFRHLRTLDLYEKHFICNELLESIGDLLQLRYLDLSYLKIKKLPKSITRLYNLQTLRLDFCENLIELPSDFSNLVNLRHLSLLYSPVSTPPRIGRLTSLRELREFKVGKEIGHRVNELKDLIHLQGFLRISELQNVVNVKEVKEAELNNKKKIDTLRLNWALRQEGIGTDIEEEEVLKALQPHSNLQNLSIEGYCGVTFPTWLGDPLFSNLVSVKLSRCRCQHLPPFGQLPSLKHLSLRELYGVKKVGREICGGGGTVKAFPSLESFYISSMPDLEECFDLEGDFSHIDEIRISDCSKLRGLRHFRFTLRHLMITRCARLTTLRQFSTILRLRLSRCDEQILSSLQYLTSLSFLAIYDFPNLTSLPNGLWSLTSLKDLKISKCPQLKSLGDVVVLPPALQKLSIVECQSLKCLPTGLKSLTSLVKLALSSCPEIHFLPEELPTTLVELVLCDCPLVMEKCEEGGEYWSKISHILKLRYPRS